MLSTLLTTLPPVVHIISTELEIPLTAVTVQSSVSGSPITRFVNPSVSSSNMVICTSGIGTIKCIPKLEGTRMYSYTVYIYTVYSTYMQYESIPWQTIT